MTVLPAPTYDGNCRRWRVSAIINFEREQDGLPPLQFNPADERWLTLGPTSRALRRRERHVALAAHRRRRPQAADQSWRLLDHSRHLERRSPGGGLIAASGASRFADRGLTRAIGKRLRKSPHDWVAEDIAMNTTKIPADASPFKDAVDELYAAADAIELAVLPAMSGIEAQTTELEAQAQKINAVADMLRERVVVADLAALQRDTTLDEARPAQQ